MRAPVYNLLGVKREALAKVLQAEIDKRGGERDRERMGQGDRSVWTHLYSASLADEIAASGYMGYDTAKRRLYAILDGDHHLVNFDTADKILSALHLNELWRTDLADSIVEPPAKRQPKKREVKPCVGCGGDWNEFQPDCRTCQSRRYWRVKRAKSAAAAAGLGGPRNGHGFTRTGRVPVGGGTNLEGKVAA